MNDLIKSFYKILLVTLACSIVIGIMIFYVPMNAASRREARGAFEAAVRIKALEADFVLSTYVSTTKSLASRTVMRQALVDYHQGSLSLAELRSSSALKYADGAAAIDYLLAAARYLPEGTLVASWTDAGPGEKPPLDTGSDKAPGIYRVVQGDELRFLVVSPIEEKGQAYGYDVCIFDGNRVLANGSEAVSAFGILDSADFVENGDPLVTHAHLAEKSFVLEGRTNERLLREASANALATVSLYSVLLLVLISFLSYFTILRFVNRLIGEHIELNGRLQAALGNRELLLKEVHHRIKNNMNTMYGLLGLQAERSSSAEARLALEDAAGRMQGMGLLYDKLYSSDNFTDLSLRDYLPLFIDQTVGNFPKSASVTVEKSIDDIVLDARRLQPLAILLNELLTNSMKYAFVGREKGSIEVTARLVEGRVRIRVRDDGPGIPDSVDPRHSTGFGLVLVANLAEQLHGTLRIVRGEGAAIELDFPL